MATFVTKRYHQKTAAPSVAFGVGFMIHFKVNFIHYWNVSSSGCQIWKEIPSFFAKKSQKFPISWRKGAIFWWYVDDTVSIVDKLIKINPGRATRTQPPDGVGCRIWPDDDTDMAEYSHSKNVSSKKKSLL